MKRKDGNLQDNNMKVEDLIKKAKELVKYSDSSKTYSGKYDYNGIKTTVSYRGKPPEGERIQFFYKNRKRSKNSIIDILKNEGIVYNMDIISKINLLTDEITTGDVAQNTAKGKVDVIGGSCPAGMVYDKKKKVCVPKVKESSVVGGSYVNGTTVNIIGSQQTRTGGTIRRDIVNLARKEPVEIEMDDKTEENIFGRKGLTFSKFLGAYVPKHIEKLDTSEIGDEDE
jgi:hypothetical protein